MRVLILDIETTPNEGYFWGLFKQNIPLAMLRKSTRMLCWAAKWEGEDDVYWASEYDHGTETMVKEIYDMVDEADAIVHFNGTSFDMKHLNREFLLQGLDPPANYKNIDLLSVVKRRFKFPSNKLAYVSRALGVTEKTGDMVFEDWIGCMEGDPTSWDKMVEYNCDDVCVTEEVYQVLQGWVPGHPNRALWVEDPESPTCRNCGSTDVVKKGIERPAQVNAYQRYKCNSCGAPQRGRIVVRKANENVLM